MNTRIFLLLAPVAILAAACGGGSSGPTTSVPPPPPATQALGGLWYGTLTNDMNMVTEEFIGMTTDSGRFRLVSVDSGVQFHGQASVTGTAVNGSGRAFADDNINWLDGNHVVDVSIVAHITEFDSLSGSWANASGESGTFEFFYDELYDKNSATNLLAAVWTGYDDLGNPDSTFTIDASGSFTGQNNNNCVSSGQISVIDPEFNLYDISSEITNCPIAGSYSGFAILADLFTSNDVLAISIDDGVRTILVGLER